MTTVVSSALVILVLLCGITARAGGLRALAIGFAVNWLLYVASWAGEWSPSHLVGAFGWYPRNVALWSLADAVMGMAALAFGYGRWWGAALWASYTLQCVLHVAYAQGWWAWGQYRAGLDTVFLAQVAIFFLAGGTGVLDYGKRLFTDRGRRLRRLRLGGALHRSREEVSGR